MIELIFRILDHKNEIMAAIGQISAGIVALSAALSTILPPASAPGAYANFRKAVNTAGMNFGHAKNANDKPAPFI